MLKEKKKRHNYQVRPVDRSGMFLFFARWYEIYDKKKRGKIGKQKVNKEELLEVSPIGATREYARKRAIELWAKTLSPKKS